MLRTQVYTSKLYRLPRTAAPSFGAYIVYDRVDVPLAQSQLCVRSLLYASGFLLSFSSSPTEPGNTKINKG